MKGELDSMRTH